MRISNVRLKDFRRFTDLEIKDLNETTRLIVLAGPNGCGKSSLFDAFNLWHQMNAGFGWENDEKYYSKSADSTFGISERVTLDVHGKENPRRKSAFYFRSAHRNDPEFNLNGLQRMGSIVDELRFRRMIQSDAAVTGNYQRLVSHALEDVFAKESPATTVGEFRQRVIGSIRDATARLFPDLILSSLGNPLDQGTFHFDKGSAKRFEYKNLSGGEKAAFDLMLDIVVKKLSFSDSIYCIDEPEAHMNTRLQAGLLQELYNLIPEPSQLWIATHSIGMMRKARELYEEFPGTVAFLDFGDHDFDSAVVISPSRPSRIFWERVLHVAMDDLASLIAPREIVICEGNPEGSIPGKNAEHDATIYNAIFAEEMPDVKFLAGGNSREVATDRLGFAATLPMVASGIKVRRLIDRDDHSSADAVRFAAQGVSTLRRRHIEAYLYDDEVLTALCEWAGKPEEASSLIAEKSGAIASSVQQRGNAADDVKSAAGEIYLRAKRRLGLTSVGNDQMAFARNTLAPLIKPAMTVYAELRLDIFGKEPIRPS